MRETCSMLEIKFCLAGYNAMQSDRSRPVFRRIVPPSSSWSKVDVSVDLYRAAGHYIPEGRTLHSHRYENL